MLCLHSCYTLIAPRLHTTCTHRHNDEVRAELACDGACQGHRGRGPGLGGAAAGITSGAGDAARYKGSLLRGAKHVAASAIRKRALRSFWVRQHALLHGDAKQRQGSRRQAVHGTSRRCAAVACVCCHMPTLAALQQAGKGKKK